MISEFARGLLSRSKSKSLLFDSNLLLLLLLGSYDIKLIKSFKRLQMFSLDDFQTLREISLSFKISTTAHVLTEISNLSNDLPHHQKQIIFPYLASRIQFLHENTTVAKDSVLRPEFVPFGLTDSVLSELCHSYVLVTNDGRLAAHLRRQQRIVLTMDDLRVQKRRA